MKNTAQHDGPNRLTFPHHGRKNHREIFEAFGDALHTRVGIGAVQRIRTIDELFLFDDRSHEGFFSRHRLIPGGEARRIRTAHGFDLHKPIAVHCVDRHIITGDQLLTAIEDLVEHGLRIFDRV